MKAEIISVGTELLLGEITDTNASYLAGQLPLLGIDLYWISQVGDNQTRLVEVLKRAWQRSDLILITGGLGPTEDDLTREAIAEMLGEELRIDPVSEQRIRERFAQRGIEMAPSNIKQAAVIPSAKAIHNARGTAPGWWVEKDGHIVMAMPGPPGEMHHMWHTEVLPRLHQRATGAIIFSKTLKVFGLPEGTVGELVSPLLSSANPTLGVYAKADGIHLRFTAKAQSQKQAEEMVARGEARVRSILGESIWGTDNDTLASVVGHVLAEKGLSLAVMEYCTGGLLTATITDAPDVSVYFRGGLIPYSNEALIAYGVDAKLIYDYGAISTEMAQAMAEVGRLRLEADIGVSITGVIGPDELEGKPAGTMYIGIDSNESKKTIKGNYSGDRFRVKRLVTVAALFELRKMLLALD
ncbi:putative competence-damage inducible protein [subsurface metagenome]